MSDLPDNSDETPPWWAWAGGAAVVAAIILAIVGFQSRATAGEVDRLLTEVAEVGDRVGDLETRETKLRIDGVVPRAPVKPAKGKAKKGKSKGKAKKGKSKGKAKKGKSKGKSKGKAKKAKSKGKSKGKAKGPG